jgi:urease accessory protein
MSLPSAAIHRAAGHWPEVKAAGVLTLDFDGRHRRRVRLTTDAGEEVILDLPKAVAMADGDGLALEDGRWLRVRAALEPVVEIRHHDAGQLTRLAWHLGNRHVPTEVCTGVLRIRPDHVIEAMLRILGGELVNAQIPFQPESGAYATGHSHSHDHRDGLHSHG